MSEKFVRVYGYIKFDSSFNTYDSKGSECGTYHFYFKKSSNTGTNSLFAERDGINNKIPLRLKFVSDPVYFTNPYDYYNGFTIINNKGEAGRCICYDFRKTLLSNIGELKGTDFYYVDSNYFDRRAYVEVYDIDYEFYLRKCTCEQGCHVTTTSSNVNTSGDDEYWNVKGDVVFTITEEGGYKFKGFFDKTTNALISSDRSITIKQDDYTDYDLIARTYFNYYVSFDSNGGEGVLDQQEIIYGESKALKENTFNRHGYVFTGWNTKPDGSGTSYEDKEVILDLVDTPNGVVTLYAQWRKANILITNSDTTKGSLILFSITENRIVATEKEGLLAFESIYGNSYRIDSNIFDAIFISPKGINISGDEYTTSFSYTGTPIETTFEYTQNPTYSISVSKIDTSGKVIAQDCGSFEITPNPNIEVDGNGEWVSQKVNFKVTTAEGWDFKAYNVSTATGNVIVSETANSNTFELQLTTDVIVKLIFDKKKYNVIVDIDELSKEVNAGMVNESYLDTEHGKPVILTATPNDGFALKGWYVNDVLISTENSYAYVPISNVTIKAKFKALISLALDCANGNLGKDLPELEVDGVVYDSESSFTKYCDIGSTISFKIIYKEWYLQYWYTGIEDDRVNVVDYSLQGDIKVSSPYAMSAFMRDQASGGHTIHCSLHCDKKLLLDSDIKEYFYDVITFEVDEEFKGVPAFGGGIGSPSSYDTERFSANQAVNVKVMAHPSITIVSEDAEGNEVEEVKYFKYFVSGFKEGSDKIYEIDEEKIISTSNVIHVLANTSKYVYACYGEIGDVTVTLNYGLGNRSMGTFSIDGVSNETSDDGTASVIKEQLSQANIKVFPKNGYLFRGWYTSLPIAGRPVYEGDDISITITSETNLYAYFDENPNAIYEWEGSEENKMMDWQSKVYSAPQPFNPSACRVEALNYPQPLGELSVEMYSSPDAEPTEVTKLTNIVSQDARRLPFKRREKYIRLSVKNDAEVDSIAVSTSMGGLLA